MLTQKSLKTVIEKVNHAIILSDAKGNFIMWNKAAEDILGLPHDKSEVGQWKDHFKITKPDGVMYEHEDLPIMKAAVKGLYTSKEHLYLTSGGGPGKHLEVEAFPLRNEDGNIIGAAAAFKDISDHVKMQQFAEELWVAFQGMQKLLRNNFFS